MEVIVGCMVLGCIPGLIAKYAKNRSFFGWWLFGAMLFIVALPASLLVSSEMPAGMKMCPACREYVHIGASICKHCRSSLL